MKHQLNQLHKLIMPTGKKIGYKLFMFKGPLIFRCTCWYYKRRDAREARPKAARSGVYKFAARAAHNHDNWTIKFDLV